MKYLHYNLCHQISRGSIKVQFEIVEEGDSAPLEEIVKTLQTVVCLFTLVLVFSSVHYYKFWL